MITADYTGTAKVNLTSALVSSTSVGGQFYNTEVNHELPRRVRLPGARRRDGDRRGDMPSRRRRRRPINTTIGAYAQQQFGWRDRLFVTGAVRVDNNSAFGGLQVGHVSEGQRVVGRERRAVLELEQSRQLAAASRGVRRSRASAGGILGAADLLPVVGPGGTNAVTPGALGNSDLRPERGKEIELGFETGLFNRLSIDFTYYSKTTQNEIVNQPVAPSTGFSGNQLINLGKVVNSGIELQARLQAVTRRDFDWEIVGNFTTISNTIKSNITNTIASAGQYNIVGYPIGGLWSRRVVSADRDPTTNLAINVLCDGGNASNLAPGAKPGPATACASAPFVYIGNPTPSKTFSLGNTFMIGKSLRLYGLVDGRRGNRIWNQNEEIRCDGLAGAPLCRANYYPLEYSTTYLAAASLNAAVGNYLDQFMEDASFVKLRELSATYFIPSRFLPRVTNPSITFAARELHTWTNYGGIDPEGAAQTANGGATAIDQGVIPQLTRFLVTFNFSW